MGKKNIESIPCVLVITEGGIGRLTAAFVDVYYGIKNGIYEGPLLPEKSDDKTA